MKWSLVWVLCGVGPVVSIQAQPYEKAFLEATRKFEEKVQLQADRDKVRLQPAIQKKLKRWDDALAVDPQRSAPLVQMKYRLYKSAHLLGAMAVKDPLYQPSVATLEERLERFERKSPDLAGQISNGIYRVTEMSGLWVASCGVDHDRVELVMARLKYEDKNAPTVHRQMRNGTYRAVEMYLLLAQQREVADEKIAPILQRLKEGDTKAKTIFEQIENGLSRMSEMLALATEAQIKKKDEAP